MGNMHVYQGKSGKDKLSISNLLLLLAVLAIATTSCMGVAQLKLAHDLDKIQKIYEHPELSPGTPVGYVDFWVATSFGMWMKDLKEGPTVCDGWNMFPLMESVKGEPLYKNEHGYPMRIGSMKQLTWPGTLGGIKYRPIADNFSGIRIAMPAGEKAVGISYDTNICPLPDNVAARVKAKEPGWSTYSEFKIPVTANRITVVQLHFQNEGDRLGLYAWQGPATLPAPKDIKKLSPDPNAYAEYIQFLDSPVWGMRWYAARRLGFIENRAAIAILQEKLKTEKHQDVRTELAKAIDRLK